MPIPFFTQNQRHHHRFVRTAAILNSKWVGRFFDIGEVLNLGVWSKLQSFLADFAIQKTDISNYLKQIQAV